VRIAAKLLLLPAALVLGACTLPSLPDLESIRAPDPATIFRPSAVNTVREKQLPPVTAEEMVDTEGRCASATVVSAPDPGSEPGAGPAAQPASVPLIPTGIGLDMTECDVVKRAGAPERVQIGNNEHNERTVVLTYIRGQRPGIYHFTSGRLTSMERAPEPPPEARPQRRQPPKRQPPPRQDRTVAR
jgi:hypothetical protein